MLCFDLYMRTIHVISGRSFHCMSLYMYICSFLLWPFLHMYCTYVHTYIHMYVYIVFGSFTPPHTHTHPYLPFPRPDLFQSDPHQLNKIAKELIGSVCYVGWPHLVEAKVVAVSTSTTKWVLWNATQASLWGECMHTNVCLMNNCTVCTYISGLCLHRQTLVWHPAYIHTVWTSSQCLVHLSCTSR